MNLEELRQRLAALRDEIRTLSEAESLDDTQSARFETALTEYEETAERARVLEERNARVEGALRSATGSAEGHDTPPGQIRRDDPFTGDVRADTPRQRTEVRDRAMRVLEERGSRLSDHQRSNVERLMRTRTPDTDGTEIAQRMLLTENDEYRSAFMKGISRQNPAFTAEEVEAVNRFRAFEARAANEGTPSAGGYGVPVLIDPTIILTSGAADAPILEVSRIVTITTNQWKGVSSAGVSWGYVAEGGVVADGSPTLAQPTIPVYSARGFIPYSLEIGDDYPGFQDEMSRLLDAGYVNLLATKTMTGSGTAEPTGIFTAMQNVTTGPAHVIATTAGTLGAVDVRNAWGALPERFRPNANYVMSVSVENLIRAWGNNLALSDYTVNMGADGVGILTGRRVITTDYAPQFTGLTTAFSYLVVGDFQHFVIVQRAGMTVELVPHLFDPTTGRPTGQRGWFAFARHGFNVDTPNAFRLVSNT